MSDDVDFEAEEAPKGPLSSKANEEVKQFSQTEPKPNTIVIPLWKSGHLSFNPDGSVPVFAVIALFLLLITVLITTGIGAFAGDTQWMQALVTALGHAITAVVGAILGASISKKDNND